MNPNSLNSQQSDCVLCASNAVVVVAGPGSGKTKTLTTAVEQRLASGVPASGILLLTFTRLAAAEMRTRLKESMGTVPRITIGTFHSVCYGIVCANWEKLGYSGPDIAIYDRTDQVELVDQMLEMSRLSASRTAVCKALGKLGQTGDSDATGDVKSLVDLYMLRLREHNAVDYNVVPYLARWVIGAGAVTPWTDIFVDEAQDLDSLQQNILHLLRPKRLFVVGDSDQVLYSWRGADPASLSRIAEEWTARTFVLDLNYRSLPAILAPADRLIANNKHRVPKKLRPVLDGDGEVAVRPDEDLIPVVSAAMDFAGETTAVLARTNQELHICAEKLRTAGIKYVLVGRRERLLEREMVKRALAYLAWPEFPRSPTLMRRVLFSEGMQELSVAKAYMTAKTTGRSCFDVCTTEYPQIGAFFKEMEGGSIVEQMAHVFGRLRTIHGFASGDQGDLARLMTEYVRAETFAKRSSGGFVSWLALRDEQDDVELDAPLQLMTIHACKGLEFDSVVVVGLHDRVLPHKANHVDPGLSEERRLMFVAMTRARKRLFLMRPQDNPSRFLFEAGLMLGDGR